MDYLPIRLDKIMAKGKYGLFVTNMLDLMINFRGFIIELIGFRNPHNPLALFSKTLIYTNININSQNNH